MEVIHDLRQIFLGLVLSGHIVKADAIAGGDVDPGVALSQAEGHGVGAARVRHHFFCEILPQRRKDQNGQQKGQEKAQQRRGGLLRHPGELRPGGIEPLRQRGIVHFASLVDLRPVLIGEEDLGILHLHGPDVLFLDHLHEGAVVHLLHLGPQQQRRHHQIE